ARLADGHHEDRRPHGRVRDEQADELRALPDLLHADRLAHPVEQGQGLAQVRRAAVRHRAVPRDEVRPARAARARGIPELLGRQAPAEDRPARPAADARADHAAGRAAQRPGGLDRGAAAGLHPAAQGWGLFDHAELLPAQLDAHAAAGQGAVDLISTSGSGQMLPLAMNELIQKNLKEVGIDVDLQPVEWNTLLTRWRAGFKTAENEGLNAWNISWNFLEPWSGFGRFFHSKAVVPVAVNTMPYINPEAD